MHLSYEGFALGDLEAQMRYCLSHGGVWKIIVKTEKWCFHLGCDMWVLLVALYGPSSPLFLVVSSFWCPIGLFCSVRWCLLCSLLISYSTALIGSVASPHFPRCLQVGLMLKTNKLKIISDLSSFGQRLTQSKPLGCFCKGLLAKNI